MTNINELIGKKLSIEVGQTVNLNIKILSEEEVEYQFIGTDDDTEDPPVITQLEKTYDNIEGIVDYSFTDAIDGRYFLFQFVDKPRS